MHSKPFGGAEHQVSDSWVTRPKSWVARRDSWVARVARYAVNSMSTLAVKSFNLTGEPGATSTGVYAGVEAV